MAYAIHYAPKNNKKYQVKKERMNQKWIICAAVVSICLLLFNTAIRNTIINFLLPGDPQVTKAAISQFVEDIRSGEEFDVAATAFCQYVIDHG